jgi:predicted deacylase
MNDMNDLFETFTIPSGQPGPRLLITAGVHGDEYEPMLAAAELLRLLPGLLKKGTVTVAPVVNTGAYRLGARCGEDGLDLARICPGNAAGTISEQVAAAVSSLIVNADYFIDMHTGGLAFELYPLCGYMLHPEPALLDSQRRMAQAFGLPVVWGTDHLPNGRTLSVARDAGVPAVYLEYGGGSGIRPEVIDAYLNGCTNVIHALGMTAQAWEATEISYWVEDHTVNSGHLQTKLPAPAPGVFVPVVQLGDITARGDLLGHVVDPLGERTAVAADMDGMVFMLRSAMRVQQGDALGGILPITEHGKVVIHGK